MEIRDRHVMVAFGVCVAFATIWQRIAFGPTNGVAFGQPFSVPFGAAEALALVALFLVINRMKDDALLSRVDLLAIAAVGVAFALPSLEAASIAMATVGVMFVARGDRSGSVNWTNSARARLLPDSRQTNIRSHCAVRSSAGDVRRDDVAVVVRRF